MSLYNVVLGWIFCTAPGWSIVSLSSNQRNSCPEMLRSSFWFRGHWKREFSNRLYEDKTIPFPIECLESVGFASAEQEQAV